MAEDREAIRERFEARYAIAGSQAAADVERAVCGDVWGANGYTTQEQADALIGELDLGPDSLVLDMGTGRGWPGLYLALRSGCRLVATDVITAALAAARARAAGEGLSGRVLLAEAADAAIPIRPGAIDAVVHADALC